MNNRKQAMMDMQDKKYQPFPRSAILTVVFVVLSTHTTDNAMAECLEWKRKTRD